MREKSKKSKEKRKQKPKNIPPIESTEIEKDVEINEIINQNQDLILQNEISDEKLALQETPFEDLNSENQDKKSNLHSSKKNSKKFVLMVEYQKLNSDEYVIKKLVSNKVLKKLKKSLMNDETFRKNYKKLIDPNLEENENEPEIQETNGEGF